MSVNMPGLVSVGINAEVAMNDALEYQKDPIAELCCSNYLEKLFAFDSAIRDDCRTGESALDLLAELAPIG